MVVKVTENLFIKRWRIDLWTWGEGRKGEMYEKSIMETYITICNIESQREFAVWLRKLKQGLCINLDEVLLKTEV